MFRSKSIYLISSLAVVFMAGCEFGKTEDHSKLLNKLKENNQEESQNPEVEAAPAAQLDIREKSNLVVSVVKKVMPAVVSIHSEKLVDVPYHQFFNPFEELFGSPKDKKSQKYKQQGLGSGVIIDSEGYIITNHHVAGEADELMITLSDDRQFEAKIIGTDKLSDVAVIKIKSPPADLPVAELGNSNNMDIGETVLAIGNPFGYSNTVTMGIISAKGRTVGVNSYENYLQTDASINPGNSGGALVNLDGKVIGINTAIASRTGGSHGIGFAIPINMAKKIMQDLLDDGAVTRGYLGVYLQALDNNIASALNLDNTKGALISSVIENSPAEEAGLQDMDVIIKVDGKDIKDVNQLRNVVALLKPSQSYPFEIIRNGKIKKVDINIGEREDEKEAKKPTKEPEDDFGLSLRDLDYHSAKRLDINSANGALVMDVEPNSLADNSGLKKGDVIVEANRQAVKSAEEVYEILNSVKGEVCLLHVIRNGGDLYVGLKLD